MAGPPPLYGMCTRSRPVVCLKNSATKWSAEPTPELPYRIGSLRFFAQARNSLTELILRLVGTTMMFTISATRMSGKRSLSGE